MIESSILILLTPSKLLFRVGIHYFGSVSVFFVFSIFGSCKLCSKYRTEIFRFGSFFVI